MSNKKIWLSSPHMGGEELKYVEQAFASNWIAPLGPDVDAFEKDLCSFAGSKYAAALSSGTAALHLALINLGIGEGDEVICQSFTFSATANPIVYQKAIPVFVDSETETWNMNPVLLDEAVAERIKKGKKPKAIIAVHLYGMPAKMNKIISIAEKYSIPLIEDAAESLGSLYNNKHTGTMSIMGILSFNGNKIITTSGGGALISDNENYIKHACFLSTQARDEAPHYQHSHIGYNYRMSNICAAIGRGQMQVLKQRIEQRRNIFNFYSEQLPSIKGISFLREPAGHFSNRWLTTILVDETKTKNKINREKIRLRLLEDNIDSRPLWKPLHLQPVFSNYPVYTNGVSEKLFRDGLCLPSGSNLSDTDLKRIVQIIQSLF